MGSIVFYDPTAVEWTLPADAYPAEVLPRIRDCELSGSRVKIHHRGTAELPQLLEVQVDPGIELASHSHDTSEIIVVVEGELRVGARTVEVGQSMLVPGGTLYAVRAGTEGARFLNFRGVADYTYLDRATYLERRAERGLAPGT